MDLIVAVDKNWAIGLDNELLVRIPEDLKRFRALTTGNTVIVGKKTLDSFPGGQPLPNRRTIVVCYENEETPEGVIRAHGIEQAADIAKEYDTVFVIGGESIYRAMLDMCDTAHVTKIDREYIANRYFPNLDKNPDWELCEEAPSCDYNGISYAYCTYKKRNNNI